MDHWFLDKKYKWLLLLLLLLLLLYYLMLLFLHMVFHMSWQLHRKNMANLWYNNQMVNSHTNKTHGIFCKIIRINMWCIIFTSGTYGRQWTRFYWWWCCCCCCCWFNTAITTESIDSNKVFLVNIGNFIGLYNKDKKKRNHKRWLAWNDGQ